MILLSVKVEGGSRGCPWAGTNGSKIEFSCKWREDEVVIAWSHILSLAITATALSDNFFVNKIKGGVKGSPMSRHKWRKKGKNRIFRQMAGKWEKLKFLAILPYLCLLRGDPLTPHLLLLTKMLSLDTVTMIAVERRLLQATITPFSCYLSENSILGNLSPFVPAYGQPLDPTSVFFDKNVITGCCCNDIYGKRACQSHHRLKIFKINSVESVKFVVWVSEGGGWRVHFYQIRKTWNLLCEVYVIFGHISYRT